MACDNCGVEYHGKNLVLVYGEESLCPNCLWTELTQLRERVKQLRTELAQLREQSACEHAAWEAMADGKVDMLEVEEWKHGRPVEFAACNAESGARAANPIDAVLAAVEAAKQDAAAKGECDHPWHRNPGLITDCPECTKQDAGTEPIGSP